MNDLASRSTRDVFDDHLDLAQQGLLYDNITRKLLGDCVILTNRGAFRGHEGRRQLASLLQQEIPDAEHGYINRLVESRFALLERTAVTVNDGADSFVIENGKLVAQTIHYTLSARKSRRTHRPPGAVAAKPPIGPDAPRSDLAKHLEEDHR
jgi:hypothetical protein